MESGGGDMFSASTRFDSLFLLAEPLMSSVLPSGQPDLILNLLSNDFHDVGVRES